jgi:hypothetical protein
VELAPPLSAPREIAPHVVDVDNGYIYPADGVSDGQRYPAPPGYRRVYSGQPYTPQRRYYVDRGNAPQEAAPQPYQPRGFFSYPN